jgi:hypothetical protein
MKVLSTRWIHKCAIFEAIVLELLLICLRYPKCLKNLVIFELQRGLGSTILYNTQHLKIQKRRLDKTSISAYIFIINFCFANITFVLDFNEIYIDDKATDFDDVADDVV